MQVYALIVSFGRAGSDLLSIHDSMEKAQANGKKEMVAWLEEDEPQLNWVIRSQKNRGAEQTWDCVLKNAPENHRQGRTYKIQVMTVQ